MFMAVQDRVKALIERLAPSLICASCISERLDIGQVELSERFANELIGHNGFERQHGICSMCGETGKATRFRSH